MRRCNKAHRPPAKVFFPGFARKAFPSLCALLFLLPAALWAQGQQANAVLADNLADNNDATRAAKSPDSVPPARNASQQEGFRLRVETDLVVLHATVLDKMGKPVTELTRDHFQVYENNVEQQLKVFKQEDTPVSVGILVDNSGSMRDKRKGVNAAALQFVRSSHPMDEVFIVNFNDEPFLDTDFTDNLKLLEEGLEKIDSRGGTALYSAIDASLKHLSEKGTRDKKVLLAVTDGEDNASRLSLEEIVQAVQRSDAVIYTVGLLSGESSRSVRRTKRALEAISQASGGKAYFPGSLSEVQSIASNIAADIRNQYVLAYTPTALVKDGAFRKVEVKLRAPRKYGKLSVRTRTGYYADPQSGDQARADSL